jgi:hypothetical protein
MATTADDLLGLTAALVDEGDGQCSISIFPSDLLLWLMPLTVPGSALDALIRCLHEQLKASMRAGLECVSCDGPIPRYRPPSAIAVVKARADDPQLLLACPLCRRCCADHGDSMSLRQAALAGIMRRLPVEGGLILRMGVVGHA